MDNNSNIILAFILTLGAGASTIIVFLITREITTWYFKLNKIVKTLEEIRNLLEVQVKANEIV